MNLKLKKLKGKKSIIENTESNPENLKGSQKKDLYNELSLFTHNQMQ